MSRTLYKAFSNIAGSNYNKNVICNLSGRSLLKGNISFTNKNLYYFRMRSSNINNIHDSPIQIILPTPQKKVNASDKI